MSSPIVLITGANQGIGYGVLSQLCKERPSWTYILACRNVAAGEAAAARLREAQPELNLSVIELDVTSDTHISAAAAQVKSTHGRVDILVNNAGYLYPPGVEGMASLRAVLNATLDLNATSTVVLTTQLLPLLHRSADPKVINVTSGTSSMARVLAATVPSTLAYGGSKVALNGFGVQLQGLEWARVKRGKDPGASAAADAARAKLPDAPARARAMGLAGIELDPNAPPARIYTVAPGVTRTNFTNNTIGRDPEVAADVILRLALDEKQAYPGGTFWEVSDEGEMREVPW